MLKTYSGFDEAFNIFGEIIWDINEYKPWTSNKINTKNTTTLEHSKIIENKLINVFYSKQAFSGEACDRTRMRPHTHKCLDV